MRMPLERSIKSTQPFSLILSAAAEAVGYKSVPYFYKIFTSHTGLTPSEYRKRHKGRAE